MPPSERGDFAARTQCASEARLCVLAWAKFQYSKMTNSGAKLESLPRRQYGLSATQRL